MGSISEDGNSKHQLSMLRSIPLSESKITLAQDLISHHERAIASIDDEIALLLRNVRLLQFRRQDHEEQIKYCKGTITLASRMPIEILASIFDDCTSDGWTRTPILVSQVCSQWRRASVIPSVWSYIYVNCDARDPCGRTRFWLDKAQNSLLRITLEVRNDTSQLSSVVALLLERSSQWRDFTINSAFLRDANYILELCKKCTPLLRSFNVSVMQEFDGRSEQGDDFQHDLMGIVNLFTEAPRLRTVRIAHHHLPSYGVIPASITNLYIDLQCCQRVVVSSVAAVIRLLQGLPVLQTFSLGLPPGHDLQSISEHDETLYVELPVLQTLILVGMPDIYGILPHLITPALLRLHLRSSIDPLEYPHAQTGQRLAAFIDRASPPLELLDLRDIDLPLADFSNCLAGLSSLKELRLHESEISDYVIRQLNGPAGLCPRLTRLDFRWCGQVTGLALVELVRSRLYSNGRSEPITAITIINCSFVEEPDVLTLAQTTVCRLKMHDSDDYCRSFGCCQNDRYRRRLHLRQGFSRTNYNRTGKLIF